MLVTKVNGVVTERVRYFAPTVLCPFSYMLAPPKHPVVTGKYQWYVDIARGSRQFIPVISLPKSARTRTPRENLFLLPDRLVRTGQRVQTLGVRSIHHIQTPLQPVRLPSIPSKPTISPSLRHHHQTMIGPLIPVPSVSEPVSATLPHPQQRPHNV